MERPKIRTLDHREPGRNGWHFRPRCRRCECEDCNGLRMLFGGKTFRIPDGDTFGLMLVYLTEERLVRLRAESMSTLRVYDLGPVCWPKPDGSDLVETLGGRDVWEWDWDEVDRNVESAVAEFTSRWRLGSTVSR